LESADGRYFSYNWFFNQDSSVVEEETTEPGSTSYSGIPTIAIQSVETATSVTVLTENFPAGESFTVRMGAFGTLALDGIVVDTTESGEGGSFEKTYAIPEELKGSQLIAIRLDSANGYYTYNWFYNIPPAEPVAISTTIPTISIVSVVKNTSVTIQTDNFPPDQEFTVQMGAIGSKGIDGIVVGTTSSGAGGAFEVTYSIPAELADKPMIAIRLDSADGVYFAYNWFFNQ
jgi:hypothetical protein